MRFEPRHITWEETETCEVCTHRRLHSEPLAFRRCASLANREPQDKRARSFGWNSRRLCNKAFRSSVG